MDAIEYEKNCEEEPQGGRAFATWIATTRKRLMFLDSFWSLTALCHWNECIYQLHCVYGVISLIKNVRDDA